MTFTDKRLNFLNQFYEKPMSERWEQIDKMTFTEKEIDSIDEQHDELIDRYEHHLTPIELYYLHYQDNNLNTCDKCSIIKNTWNTDEFNWDCDHDLKGYQALCTDCYFELNCKSFHELENEQKN
mgnify:CR=1 FL=1